MSTPPVLGFTPFQRVRLYDDFTASANAGNVGNLNWTSSTTGAGAPVAATQTGVDASHMGVLSLQTGTTATGRSTIALTGAAGTGQWNLTGGTYSWYHNVYIPTLSISTDRYIYRAGFGDTLTADFADGVYFEYDESTSANWRIKTANTSTRTAVDTGVAVVAATWIQLQMIITGSTSAQYFINGTSVGTNSTNMPTSSAMYPAIFIQKSAGTTSRAALIDYFFLNGTLNSTR